MGIWGSGPPQKFGCGVFYGSDPHENFTEINLTSAKSTPTAALEVYNPLASCKNTLPAQYLWLPGLFSCRSYSLQLSPGFFSGPDLQCRLFQTDVCLRRICLLDCTQRVRGSLTITALYKSTYLHTYFSALRTSLFGPSGLAIFVNTPHCFRWTGAYVEFCKL